MTTSLLVLAFGSAVAARAAQPKSGPRVLLLYDLEGVTAAAAPRDVQFGAPGYPATRESLTEDVNAAIRGLLKAYLFPSARKARLASTKSRVWRFTAVAPGKLIATDACSRDEPLRWA